MPRLLRRTPALALWERRLSRRRASRGQGMQSSFNRSWRLSAEPCVHSCQDLAMMDHAVHSQPDWLFSHIWIWTACNPLNTGSYDSQLSASPNLKSLTVDSGF